jgi:protein SERAC1
MLSQVLGSSFVAEEHELKNVVSSTVAVMFLGTPHRGSQDLAEIGDVARKLASVLMMDTNPAMIDALGLKTSDLERCQESFSMLWRKQEFRVKTFQEARGLTAINLGILNEKVSRI